jgi:hypothetical protein
MHRPTLILRRFGPLTFGLGYYDDDGRWVDHQPTGAAPAPGATMDVVHGWLSCCDGRDEQPEAAHLAQLHRATDLSTRRAAAGR